MSEPDKAIISYVSHWKPLIHRTDCCLEAVSLNYLNRRLILTLTGSYSNRNFKLIEVSGVITVYGDEFLYVINNDKKTMTKNTGPSCSNAGWR